MNLNQNTLIAAMLMSLGFGGAKRPQPPQGSTHRDASSQPSEVAHLSKKGRKKRDRIRHLSRRKRR